MKFQISLGKSAQLAYSLCILNPEGEIIGREGFQEQQWMPLASTMKIAIALLVYKQVYKENLYRLDEQIKILYSDFSPDSPWNTLDRYFFFPWKIKDSKKVDELLTLMMTESDNTATDKLIRPLA